MRSTSSPREKHSRIRPTRLGSGSAIGESSSPDTRQLELISSCNCDKISSLFSSFDNVKVNLLKTIGFDGLLKMPPLENLNVDLIFWLYQRFDYKKKCIVLDGGHELHFTDADVHLVFGIPFEGRSVHFDLNQPLVTVNEFKAKLYSVSSSPSLTMCFLEEVLTKDYGAGFSTAERDAFSIAAVLYSVCYLLAPESRHDFPMHFIQTFLPDVKPEGINWAYLVLWTLNRACDHATKEFNKGSKIISLFGCSLFLQVFYLDNLNFGPSTPYHYIFPRASVYWPDFMGKLILSDCAGTSEDKLMIFGKTEVRAPFDVCYTRGWRDQLMMQHQLERISPVDYLSSIEILSEAIQLVDKFSTQFNHPIMNNQYADLVSLELIQKSCLIFRSKTNLDIQSLFTKAADYLKRRNLCLHYRHIPKDVPSFSHNHLSIGTSNQRLLKRNISDVSGSPLAKIIMKRAAISQARPIVRQASSNQLLQGQVQHVPRSSRNSPAALLQSSTSKEAVVDQASSSNSQLPFDVMKPLTSITKLPISFSDVSWENKYKCYMWMTNPLMTTDELNRDWIAFSAPEALSIPGHVVQHCLKLSGSFTVSIVDAIMVLWNYLDEKMYNNYQEEKETHKIWRLFLPASFAEIVIDNGDFLSSDTIRSSFLGDHITYDLQDCNKIIIPVILSGETWSCYIWDFEFKSITVFDPVLMDCPAIEAQQKHHDTVFKLHSALFACITQFFSGWDVKEQGWVDIYLTDIGHKCSLQNSGVYAVYYARCFSPSKGHAIKHEDPNEFTLWAARGEILYHFFTCTDNKGYKPHVLMQNIGCVKI